MRTAGNFLIRNIKNNKGWGVGGGSFEGEWCPDFVLKGDGIDQALLVAVWAVVVDAAISINSFD